MRRHEGDPAGEFASGASAVVLRRIGPDAGSRLRVAVAALAGVRRRDRVLTVLATRTGLRGPWALAGHLADQVSEGDLTAVRLSADADRGGAAGAGLGLRP